MSRCERRVDAGAWVLGALDAGDAAAFEEHLRGCSECAAQVEHLRVPADALALATEQVAPPPALKDRIMRVVESEAQLLQAAGPDADRAAAAPRARRGRRWFLRPLPVAGLAAATLAVGVVAGVLVSGESTRTVQAKVAMAGASATVHISDDHARLEVRGMRNPPSGHVYEVWVRRGNGAPEPAGALFTVLHGHGDVDVGSVKGVDVVMVTSEPAGGSVVPSSNPIITAAV